MAGGEPAGFPQIGQELGERRAGDAGARLEVGGRPRRHRRADDPVAGLLPADPGGPEHGRLARSGLADHQVVAVARGEQCPDTVGLFAVEMGVESEDVVDRAGGDPAGSFADACDGGADDALLGGQELGGRVAPVAARGRDDVAAPRPDVLGAGIGVGEDPDDAVPFEKSGRQCRASSGVTSNALATALMASRRVNVDPSRVTGIARVPGAPESEDGASSISQSSSDTPFSPARTRKTSSTSSGPGGDGRSRRRGQR